MTPERVVAESQLAFAVRDGLPVNVGHTLVIPRRHVGSWFDCRPEEQQEIFTLVERVKEALAEELRPDGYNVGINVGEAAGQTVMHVHVHVIPRFRGDVDDPTGGVRLVIPERGNYRSEGRVARAASRRPRWITDPAGAAAARPKWALAPVEPLCTGGAGDPFIAHLMPLFASAREVAIVAAFVQDGGLDRLREPLESCLQRGVGVRVLTGDYLNITQARPLRRLLDWVCGTREEALQAPGQEAGEAGAEEAVVARAREPEAAADGLGSGGQLAVRVVEVERLRSTRFGRTFHPKAWIFRGSAGGSAFVGSSNISDPALTDGVEWNLRIDSARDPVGFDRVLAAFDLLWHEGRPLDAEWLEAYAERARAVVRELPAGEVHEEPAAPPEPWEVQLEALEALRRSRLSHRRRALVVLATGLGKTWVAAFDVQQFAGERGRMPRVLFLAHRVELLRQAAATFRRLFPDLAFGWFAGGGGGLAGDVVFASVMKLGRPEHLSSVAPDAFDYVVIDEVHHADARTYRRILSHLRPRFLLGLTATPERADAGDILGLFDDHVAHEADIGAGIAARHLVPFNYFGLRDVVDYAPIPWRNRRFDPEELSRAVQTEARMERLWEAWERHEGRRSLVFCCSIAHARFVERWLGARGVRLAAVHSGADSADRAASLASLRAGELDAVCTVDLFNEGVDLPAVDRVVMLRPTESPVLFLQQLGRGLRRDEASGKEALTVIDFVGNHRVFLDRVRMLLDLAPGDARPSLTKFLRRAKADALPGGCSVNVELEAVDMLRRLVSSGGRQALVRAYRELRAARGERPSIGELYRRGYNPATLKQADGWFDFLAAEGHLSPAEEEALAAHGDWLRAVERRESMNKSFKMVALQALLDAGGLAGGMDVRDNARRSYDILHRSPELYADLAGEWRLDDPAELDLDAWTDYWRTWPLEHWSGKSRRSHQQTWFRVRSGRFEPRFSVAAEVREPLADMVREIVDYRLARYRRSHPQEPADAAGLRPFQCKLIHAGKRPIIRLPDRERSPWVPRGETDVRLPDDRIWRFRFQAQFCNIAHPVGSARNQLPDLLRGWFGPAAGQPGTEQWVRFHPSAGEWWVEPAEQEGAEIIPFPARGKVVAFPSLHAAAGWQVAGSQHEDGIETGGVALPGEHAESCFAVRASGTSMQGWRREIRDGDWLVMRWARGLALSAVEGRVVLVARGHPEEGRTHHLKRVRRDGRRFELVSDNPHVPAMPAQDDDELIAVHVRTIRPEDLAPPRGIDISAPDLARTFGLSEPPRPPHQRIDGHLLVLLEDDRPLAAPDRTISTPAPELREAETAFVLARTSSDAPWRYLGVGRRTPDGTAWHLPDADHATWKALGSGRTASRPLPDRWLETARLEVDSLLRDPGGWVDAMGKRCRVAGPARRGGIRIDGGPGGFAERTVSLTDLGWVLMARDEAARLPGLVDEASVNRIRYLEGTPRSATRWIDTGWALVLTDPDARHGAS